MAERVQRRSLTTMDTAIIFASRIRLSSWASTKHKNPRRYDPDAFAKLEAAGLVTHEVEVEDFDPSADKGLAL